MNRDTTAESSRSTDKNENYKVYCRVFISNVSKDATEEDIEKLFTDHVKVRRVTIFRQKTTQAHQGKAIVTVNNDEDAYRAIEVLNNTQFMGKKIQVQKARKKLEPKILNHEEEKYLKEVVDELDEQEPLPQLMIRNLISLIGVDGVEEFMERTREIEATGGMLVASGSRRRTKGGVFFKIAKDSVPPDVRFYAFVQPNQSFKQRAAYTAELEERADSGDQNAAVKLEARRVKEEAIIKSQLQPEREKPKPAPQRPSKQKSRPQKGAKDFKGKSKREPEITERPKVKIPKPKPIIPEDVDLPLEIVQQFNALQNKEQDLHEQMKYAQQNPGVRPGLFSITKDLSKVKREINQMIRDYPALKSS